MSRCVRKLENDEYWIVYCNTVDLVFPYLFDSEETALKFVELEDKFHNITFDNKIISIEDVNEKEGK